MTNGAIPIIECLTREWWIHGKVMQRSSDDRASEPVHLRFRKSHPVERANYLQYRLERAGNPDRIDVHREASIGVACAAVPPADRSPMRGVDLRRSHELLYVRIACVRVGKF